jgi:MFS family permease
LFHATAKGGEVRMSVAARSKRRRTLPNRVGYALAAAVIGLALVASVTPSPLYHTYSELWHFSPLTLTLIYATYAFGVLTTLLLAGGVSDDVGRRPVLLVALSVLMVSTVLFMLADSAAWLFVARGLQGLATGAALSAASAALLDLHPRRDPASVGLTNGVAAQPASASACLSRLRWSSSDRRRWYCRTSYCSSCSQSPSPGLTGCPSPSANADASG